MANFSKHSIKWISYYGISTILILTAGWQLYQSRWNQLTPWKGGGFGMYAEVHYEVRNVWAKGNNFPQPILLDTIGNNEKEYMRALLNVRRQPNYVHMDELNKAASKILQATLDTLEVWIPSVDSLSMGYKTQKKVTFIPAQKKWESHGNNQEN